MDHSPSSLKEFKIVISIINFRTPDLTIQCVCSVLADLGGIHAKVVIVDNCSGDESVAKISAWISDTKVGETVTLLQSDTNSGFSGGHNQGLSAYKADYYLVLNSDTLIQPGFFPAILAAAAETPEAGFLSPRLEFSDGGQQTSCFRFHSPQSEMIRGANSRPVTRLLQRYNVPLQMPPNPDQIEWASFACILLNARMISDIGLMDEGYFLYFEDVAYCWQAARAGWRISHVPRARVVHFRGGSGPVRAYQHEKKRLPAYYYASRTRFFRQTYGRWGPPLANLSWMTGRLVAHLRKLAGKPIPQANQSEMRDIWINSLSPLGDRRAEG